MSASEAPQAEASSDHLLRTLAAVPVSSEILDLGCSRGRHTVPLLRLGFPVHACDPREEAVAATRDAIVDIVGAETAEDCVRQARLDALDYPDRSFDWIVAYRAHRYARTPDELETLLTQARHMLKPGGWIYLTVPATPDDVAAADKVAENGHAPPQRDAEADDVAHDEADASAGPGARFAVDDVKARRVAADLAQATAPEVVREDGMALVRAIYRRVDADTPV
jgi:SAM-dependent methyltransferase